MRSHELQAWTSALHNARQADGGAGLEGVREVQTTDKKVNEVTPALFKLAADAAALAQADVSKVQAIIRTVGLAPTKSKNIVNTAQQLVELHGGAVPNTFEELEQLPGVGHKTASVVMAHCFGRASLQCAAVVIDCMVEARKAQSRSLQCQNVLQSIPRAWACSNTVSSSAGCQHSLLTRTYTAWLSAGA
jgi:HhH-GPD superfamily base excision DNA repair protein